MSRDLSNLTEDLRTVASQAAGQAVEYLASPGGQRLRRRVAAAMIVGAPLLFRTPVLRRYPVLRVIEVLGGAAAVMEMAKMIRDWEPEAADGARSTPWGTADLGRDGGSSPQ
jgi:hypothetical protein